MYPLRVVHVLLVAVFCLAAVIPHDGSQVDCPRGCLCKTAPAIVDCRSAGLTEIPSSRESYRNATKLDLSHNDIEYVEPFALLQWPALEELNIGSNPLAQLDADSLGHSQLKSLSLQSCQLKDIPQRFFSKLPQLRSLRLDLNGLKEVKNDTFVWLTSLRHLRLDNNILEQVPTAALATLPKLQSLNLSFNRIKHLGAGTFKNLTSLVELILDYNEVESIEEDAFDGLISLHTLGLRHNRIRRFTCKLSHLPFLHDLNLGGNNINQLHSGIFQQASRLIHLELRGNPLQSVERDTFVGLARLQKLILSEVKDLREFPNVNGSTALELIRIDRARIRYIPSDLCQFVPRIRSLILKSNLVEELPDLSNCRELRLLDLGNNRIRRIPDYSFVHLNKLHDLLLPHNHIKHLSNFALSGLFKLKVLDLSDNEIDTIESEAFAGLAEVQDVNLGHNQFASFPATGLESVLHIKVHNNPHLRDFPMPASFPRVQTLALSYAYHCCPFLYPDDYSASGMGSENAWRDSVIPLSAEHGIDLTAWAKGTNLMVDTESLWGNASNPWANTAMHNTSDEEIMKLQLLLAASNIPLSGSDTVFSPGSTFKQIQPIQCIPEPSPFMPCQDLFDWWSLRCGVWIVFLMALLGNGAVVFVLIFARSKMDVPRFLVCNLAMADFFMGVYLGFLAVVDASTLGDFRMHAIPWQLSSGCQIAGFLGVLSSELSVFTLAVITMERNYAITHAMHLNKRLSLRHASYIMAAGWFFALVMATLPLFGVSDYRKFAVCLPFEVGTPASLGYVIFLMLINGVAFLILMCCYLKMYCAIRGSQAWNSNDSRIAKRMALLVFTDFICWSPIAFFSLTAASGAHLITLEQAKIFTVFILPLNSCCNPFMYAILTKQFKKDCVLICKAIEESRVTRGIGRCRHSSNFSNRHTPGNTNSVGERNSSKGDGSSCHCQSRFLDNKRRRGPRWLPRAVCNFLHRIRTRESDLENSSSANEYAYQIAEIQQKQQRKHRRAGSVSSENFSSSRSDSVKAIGCGIPMRITNRRRNSWTITRKRSRDSNLSSSRNDSSTSAMTASTSAGTSAWRTSRSSVSSDCGSSTFRASLRDRERPLKVAVVPASDSAGQKRSGSLREKNSRQHPMSPLAAGILRQQSVSKVPGTLVQRTVPQYAASPTVTVTDVARPKPKPRLTRQAAVQDESYIPTKSVSFESSTVIQTRMDNYCPLHGDSNRAAHNKLQGVWESSIEEDEADGEEKLNSDNKLTTQPEGEIVPAHPRKNLAAIYSSRDKNRLGLAGFVPRKLSTISSRSCSVNPENTLDDAENPTALGETITDTGHNRKTRSFSVKTTAKSAISKSDNELYCHRKDLHIPSRMMTSMANLSRTESEVPKTIITLDETVQLTYEVEVATQSANDPIRSGEPLPAGTVAEQKPLLDKPS